MPLRRPRRARAVGRALEVGPRVFLRLPTAQDEAAFLALSRESRPLHRPWVHPPATPREFQVFLTRAHLVTRSSFLVCRRSDGAIAGVVNVSEIVRGPLQSAYLGYYAHGAFAGQGVMTEGLGLVIRHAFTRLGLHRLEANIQPDNGASIALVRRLGFRLEGFSRRYLKIGGRWKDHQRWALLQEDWRDTGRGGGPGRSPRAR